MPTDNIRLVVGGYECHQWDEVSIDSDLLIPADAWSLSLFNPPHDPLPKSVQLGATVQAYCAGELLLTGVVDAIDDSVSRRGRRLSLTGRDLIGVLLDNTLPLKVSQQVTLADLVKQYIQTDFAALFPVVHIDRGVNAARAKTAIDVGETLWTALVKLAETAGQYVWAEANGTLRVGNPFGLSTPPARLQLSANTDTHAHANPVLSVRYREDISELYSEVMVLGQDTQQGYSFYATNSVSTTPDVYEDGLDLTPDRRNQPDPAEFVGKARQPLPYKRRHIVLDPLADNNQQAAKRAKKLLQDGNLSAYQLEVDVAGWHVQGQLWTAGQSVYLDSPVMPKAAGDWVVMGRKLLLSRNQKITQLRLRRKQYWMQPIAPSPVSSTPAAPPEVMP